MKAALSALIACAALRLGTPAVAGAEPSRNAGDYVLLAGDELRVGAMVVGRGDIGVNDGLLRTYGAIVAAGSKIAAGIVRIDPQSRCAGLYFSESMESSGAGCGPGTSFHGPIVSDLGAACGFPTSFPSCAGGPRVGVGHDQTRLLDRGTYGVVELKGGGGPAKLVLRGGRYVFCSLAAARNARIEVDGAAQVFVAGPLVIGPAATITTGPQAPAVDFFVDSGPVVFGRTSRVTGSVCAPSSDLRIVGAGELTGTFVARRIRGGHRIRVTAGSASTGSTTTGSSSTSTSSTSTTVRATTTTSSTSTSTSSTTATTIGVTTSTSVTTSSTTTTSAVGTTTTTQPTATCGNCVVDPGETCDDCNTLDGDACPHNCVIQSCTPVSESSRIFAVSFTPPGGLQVAGITVLVDYPEGSVSIPGSAAAVSVRGRILMLPSGAFGAPNDLDYALRESIAVSSGSLTPGRLFEINFDDCQGASAPVPSDFGCTVEAASDSFGNALSDMTCSVTAP